MSNPRFRAHVTSSAFALTLSAPMIAMLHLIKECGYNTPEGMVELHSTTVSSLERRGLIELGLEAKDSCDVIAWKLTRAGELAYEMCAIAGLLTDWDEVNDTA